LSDSRHGASFYFWKSQTLGVPRQSRGFTDCNYDDLSIDFWILLMNVRKGSQPETYVIPAEDIRNGVRICQKGENSGDLLIYHDKPKSDGSITYYINKKFLKNGRHTYTDAWNIIK
jgi:hypothetical protein